jgi:type IV secretory pathway VirB2 component (pilin)
MQASLKIPLVAVAFAFAATVAAGPLSAQPARRPLQAIQQDSYQGPQTGYASFSDYIRSIEGIPCGVKCTLAAQQRWMRSYRE